MIENTLLTSYIIIICFSSNKQQSAVELASVCRIAPSALTWQVGEGADVANIFSDGLKQHIRLLLSWWEKGLAWRGVALIMQISFLLALKYRSSCFRQHKVMPPSEFLHLHLFPFPLRQILPFHDVRRADMGIRKSERCRRA